MNRERSSFCYSLAVIASIVLPKRKIRKITSKKKRYSPFFNYCDPYETGNIHLYLKLSKAEKNRVHECIAFEELVFDEAIEKVIGEIREAG